MSRNVVVRAVACGVAAVALAASAVKADASLLVTNFFGNTVDLYNDQTGALITPGFFTPTLDSPGEELDLNGIVVDAADHIAYVSSRSLSRIYEFDTRTGLPIASTPSGTPGIFLQLPDGTQPAGLALDPSGDLYVAYNAGDTVQEFSSSGAALTTLEDPLLLSGPSGLTFGPNGDLYISTVFGTPDTFQANVVVYNGSTLTQFATVEPDNGTPYFPSGVAVAADGSVYVADAFSNAIDKYDSSGNPVNGPGGVYFYLTIGGDTFPLSNPAGTPPFIDVDLADRPDFATFPNAPSGLTFDSNGDLLVAVLGPTNPTSSLSADENQSHGALLRYSPDGTLLQTLDLGIPPAAGLALFSDSVAAVPEPTALCLALFVPGVLAWHLVRRRRGVRGPEAESLGDA